MPFKRNKVIWNDDTYSRVASKVHQLDEYAKNFCDLSVQNRIEIAKFLELPIGSKSNGLQSTGERSNLDITLGSLVSCF